MPGVRDPQGHETLARPADAFEVGSRSADGRPAVLVVIFSVVVQGLTLGPLIRRLGSPRTRAA